MKKPESLSHEHQFYQHNPSQPFAILSIILLILLLSLASRRHPHALILIINLLCYVPIIIISYP